MHPPASPGGHLSRLQELPLLHSQRPPRAAPVQRQSHLGGGRARVPWGWRHPEPVWAGLQTCGPGTSPTAVLYSDNFSLFRNIRIQVFAFFVVYFYCIHMVCYSLTVTYIFYADYRLDGLKPSNKYEVKQFLKYHRTPLFRVGPNSDDGVIYC